MLGIVAVAFLSGCSKDHGIKDVTWLEAEIPGVATVSWTTKHSGQARVEYGHDGFDQRTPDVDASAGKATVLELEAGSDYQVKVVVEDGDKSWESEPIDAHVQAPADLANPVLDEWNPDLACEDGGFFLFSYLSNDSGAVIVDREGKYVWVVPSDDPDIQVTRARLGRDGHSILWNTNDWKRLADVATIERRSMDGRISTTTRTLNAHHDFIERPDGQMTWIAYQFADPPLDLGNEFPTDWQNFPTAYDVLYTAPEGAPDGDTPELVFDQLRDWPEGMYYNDRTEGCDQFLPGYCEVGHGNSLAYIDSTDEYQLGFRWLDATLRLDATGAVKWVFGGPLNGLSGNPDDLPVHFHYSDAWADGMMVFDNHDPDNSRVMEYTFDQSASTFSASLLAQEDKNEAILGDVRRVPIDGCDNVVVALTKQGVLQELTRDGQVVWQIHYGLTHAEGIGRVQYLSSLYDFQAQANWQ